MNNSKSNIKTRDLIYKKYNGHCAYCGCKIEKNKFNIDHIKPIKRNSLEGQLYGLDKIENHNPSCILCNSSKNSFTIEQWRKELSLKLDILNKTTKYCLLKRFGLIKETRCKIVFYFEKHHE